VDSKYGFLFLEEEDYGVMFVEMLLHPHKRKVNQSTNLPVDLKIGILQILDYLVVYQHFGSFHSQSAPQAWKCKGYLGVFGKAIQLHL
jgi:hypothetical protein